MSGMLLLLAFTTVLTLQQGHFAAPNGTRSNDGTERRPWDLATALGGGGPAKKVQPGDTIWVRGGTYKGAFRSTVAGREGAPVVIRVWPGERAVIDGAGSRRSTLYVTGAYSTFWGLELTNSNPERTTTQLGSDFRPNVVVPAAAHTRFINLIVHDGGVAFYTEPKFADVEIAGCIIYNNGWEGPDRGHGHALYLKSFTGPLLARDNVMFNQYGYGVHAYTNSGTGKLINITIEGNIAFNNGSLSRARDLAPNLLLGGADYAAGNVVRDNILYYSPALRSAGTNAMIGWKTLRNGDVIVENNYLVGGSPMVEFGFWSAARVSNNTLIRTGGGERAPIVRRDAAARGQIWRDNGERATPTATRVVVRPNLYEPGRAHVVVFNWGRDRAAVVDVSGVLASGDRYEVRNVQDLFGAPVTGGTVSGSSITIPLGGVAPPVPVGLESSPAPRTGPAFDVFLITKR
ncbi:MAG TPA: hypothetical protein VFM23_00630 [Gemmatimonadales bacterium]|nr:hypothetical protein [Gemmatimonadales bacterium]